MKKKSKIHSATQIKEAMGQYLAASKSQYAVIIEQDEDGFFVASVPALPGCHTQAKTLPELREKIKDAIKLCLSVAARDSEYRSKIKQLAYQPSFIGMEMVKV